MPRAVTEDIQSRYMAHVAQIREHLDTLTQAADDHFGADPEKLHWGHVGTAAHIKAELAEIVKEVTCNTR